jgi:3-oxoacyl-[acyl-carrier protein] reductase
MARLAGKTAIVTGGTRGIGLAIVRAFLEEGARVLYSGTSAASLAQAEAVLPAGAPARGLAADLADPKAPRQTVNAAMAAFGRVDILVANAGAVDTVGPWDVTPEHWDRIATVNLRAAFFCARDAAAAMRDRGEGGSIVTMASVAGQIGGVATGPAYVAAKAGVIGMSRSLARHFAPLGVRVNCISPADVETDMTSAWPAELRARLTAMTPLGRFGTADEVAGAAIYLASDESSYVTGQTFNVNGGLYMG